MCPDPSSIEKYLRENTGFDGKILPNSLVCNACYKLQLSILDAQNKISTNEDLQKLLISLKSKSKDKHNLASTCMQQLIELASAAATEGA